MELRAPWRTNIAKGGSGMLAVTIKSGLWAVARYDPETTAWHVDIAGRTYSQPSRGQHIDQSH
jgi:hypothetical protein